MISTTSALKASVTTCNHIIKPSRVMPYYGMRSKHMYTKVASDTNSDGDKLHNVNGLFCKEVQVIVDDKKVVILEATADAQEALIDKSLLSDNEKLDPYGSVLWPAARTLIERLLTRKEAMNDSTIFEIGAGRSKYTILRLNKSINIL